MERAVFGPLSPNTPSRYPLRIIEWLGLEGTQRIIKFQLPCHRQDHQPPDLGLDQVAQGFIQPGLEHFQGGGVEPENTEICRSPQ